MIFYFNMTEQICRLCLKTIRNEYQTIGDELKDILFKLFVNLNLDISMEPVICNECAKNLQVSISFMSTCIRIKNRNNNTSLEDVENINNGKAVPSMDHGRCGFCTTATGREGFTFLNKSNGNNLLVDMLEEYVPNLNLNNTEELLACATCLGSIQEFLNFVMNCLDVEDKIRRYVKVEGTNHKGQVELKDVQKFSLKSIVKREIVETETLENPGGVQEEFTMKVKEEVKDEVDLSDRDLTIKTEEIDIKSESFQKNQEIATDGGETYSCQCAISFRADCKICVENNSLTHGISSKIIKYKCEICSYETKYEYALNRHISLAHTSPSVEATNKHDKCTYKAIVEDNFSPSVSTSKTSSEAMTYTCEVCMYCTKHRSHFTRHMTSHDDSSIYRCRNCTYETKSKSNYERHVLTHKSPSEVPMYKCEMCVYETIQKHHLARHMLIHKNPSEVTMNKCKICAFETKSKSNLNRHVLLIHKYPARITMLKCTMCAYESKKRKDLKQHMSTHKKTSAATFKCDMCTYEAKQARCLKMHMYYKHKNPTVKDPSEITMHECEICKYRTKYKSYLTRHQLSHRNRLNLASKI